MNKEELFKKYNIDDSHNVWDDKIDNWYSVEIYREMHNGKLPPQDDDSIIWVVEFLDKLHNDIKYWFSLKNKGSMYLTAKRMVNRHYEQILKDLNNE